MEVSVIGISHVKAGRSELVHRELGFCNSRVNTGGMVLIPKRERICFPRRSRWDQARLRFAVTAVETEPVLTDNVLGFARKSKSVDGVKLYVGLPLDSVSDCNTVNHARAIAAGLKALKLLGVEGVELPIWWGIVEKGAMGKYEWSGYIALAELVQCAGLKLHVSLCFHASEQPIIGLPDWVAQIGNKDSNIFFTDRSGLQYKQCLSLAVDELPVLNGKTPLQVYRDFCTSFKSSFLPYLGSTITGITMGLGPEGELRYPSHHRVAKSSKISGVGEFQCYDKNLLSMLKQHAEANGHPLWGLGGPHDAPSYDDIPNPNNFFKFNGGSWESVYGDFFLSWYSNQLVNHGDRILSMASSVFGDDDVTICSKLPLSHTWYKTTCHPSELTSGFYNTYSRDGYQAVARMFARNSCKIILPGMDLSDEHQPQDCLCSPELLLDQIMAACRENGVEIAGQNSSVSGAPRGFERIKKNLMAESGIDLFTYQRMGAYFFSPEHFPSFTELVRSLNQPELDLDDLPTEGVDGSVHTSSNSGVHMQTA